MHRPSSESSEKPNGYQIKESSKKPFGSKLCFPMFSCLVLYYFLSDVRKASVLGQYWDITMHVASYSNVFLHVFVIGFVPTINLVAPSATASPARTVKYLRREAFSHLLVVAFLPPSRCRVV